MKNWIKVLSINVLLLVCCFAFGLAGTFQVKTQTAQAQTINAWLENGASVRFGDAGNGLRFCMQIDASTFDETASYGILIAPAVGYDLSEKNVFGKEAIYNWAVKNNEGEWVYKPENGKTQIVNLMTEEFRDSFANVDGQRIAVKEFYASLINVAEENIAREFRAVGYVRTGVEGNYSYTLVGDDDNVRSMAYVAQKVVDGTSGFEVSEEQAKLLKENYIDKVDSLETTFTQEYYLEQADGTYKKADALTQILDKYNGTPTTIGDQVKFVGKDLDGYFQLKDKGVLSGTVYANGKLTLKAYYDLIDVEIEDIGLIDIQTTESLAVDSLEGSQKILYKVVNGKVEEVCAISNDSVDVSKLNGIYRVYGLDQNGCVLSAIQFDVYNSLSSIEWQPTQQSSAVYLTPVNSSYDLTKTSATVLDVTPDGGQGSGYYDIVGGAERYGFYLRSLHSKAYYERYKGACVYFTFQYRMTAESLDQSVTVHSMQAGFINTQTWSNVMCGEWQEVSIALETLLDNWGTPVLVVGDFFKSVNGEMGAILGGAQAIKESHLQIGNFTIQSDVSKIEPIIGESRMVEVDGKYDLLDLLNQTQKVQFAGYSSLGQVEWTLTAHTTPIEIDGSVVDFDKIVKRIYTVEAFLGDILLYTAEIDFYNSDEFLWNESMDPNEIYSKKNPQNVNVSTVQNPAGRTGEYIQIEYLTAGHNFYYLPAHTKDYYAMFVGKNISISLDYYFDNSTLENNHAFCGDAKAIQRYGGQWHNRIMELDALYQYWDKAFGSDTGWQGHLMCISKTIVGTKMYFGNVYSMLTISGAVEETDARLINVEDNTSYNLNNVLQAANVDSSLYENKQIIWTLTAVNTTKEITIENGLVDLSKIEKRVYTVKANLVLYGMTTQIYTGMIDLYSAKDGLIWNEFNLDSILVSAEKYDKTVEVIDIENAGVVGNRTGKYLHVEFNAQEDAVYINHTTMLMPIHSKAYYQLFANQNLYITYDYLVRAYVGDSVISYCTGGHYAGCSLNGTTGHRCDWYQRGNKWYSVSISIDTLLANWNKLSTSVFVSGSYVGKTDGVNIPVTQNNYYISSIQVKKIEPVA